MQDQTTKTLDYRTPTKPRRRTPWPDLCLVLAVAGPLVFHVVSPLLALALPWAAVGCGVLAIWGRRKHALTTGQIIEVTVGLLFGISGCLCSLLLVSWQFPTQN
jgi:hypothetical protein